MTYKTILLFLIAPAACAGVYSDPKSRDPKAGDTGEGHDPHDAGPEDMASPDADPPIQITSGPKRVFVTSQAYQGGLLGGLAGADAKCATRATAAGLTGTYKAWLSDREAQAVFRLTHSTGNYLLVDGTTVAADWSALASGSLAHAIDHDELGALYAPPLNCFVVGGIVPVWTATRYNGRYNATTGGTCNDWTEIQHDGFYIDGDVGNAQSHDTHWSESLCGITCSESAALYCLEQ